MVRQTEEILWEIRQFEPIDDNWLKLDALLAELWETQEPEKGIAAMLGVLERFPDEGGGVLWSIVHGLESMPNYEDKLPESVHRQPSHLGLIMISRIANTGVKIIGSQPITDILQQVLLHKKASPALREEAEEIKERINNSP